jgi:hypothetical protein
MKNVTVTITLADEEQQTFEAFCEWLQQQRNEVVFIDQVVEIGFSNFLTQWKYQQNYIYSAAEREKE